MISKTKSGFSFFLILLISALYFQFQKHKQDQETLPHPQLFESTAQFKKLSLGKDHLCAIDLQNKIWCWGKNNFGQLGQNETFDSSRPLLIEGLEQATDLVSGHYFTCAVAKAVTPSESSDSSELYCWGDNSQAQLGQGHLKNLLGPQAVSISQNKKISIKKLFSGPQQACAQDSNGVTYCWGSNLFSEFGFKSTGPEKSYYKNFILEPSVVNSFSKIKQLKMNENHACFLNAEKKVFCWGDNTFGQLAQNLKNKNYPEPTLVNSLQNVSDLALGLFHTCALTEEPSKGQVYCFGSNSENQLGLENIKQSEKPLHLKTNEIVSQIHSGPLHSCFITEKKAVFCWGINSSSQVGEPHFEPKSTLTEVKDLRSLKIVDIYLNATQSLALNQDKMIYHWGAGYAVSEPHLSVKKFGSSDLFLESSKSLPLGLSFKARSKNMSQNQLVDNLDNKTFSGVDLSKFKILKKGRYHHCGVTNTDEFYCWGKNSRGQLGVSRDQVKFYSSQPVKVGFSKKDQNLKISQISLGQSHTCVVLNDQSIRCWGDNSYGQLAQDPKKISYLDQPKFINSISAIKEMTSGLHFNCVVTQSEELKCWGQSFAGAFESSNSLKSKIEIDEKKYSFSPQPVFNLTKIKSIVAGGTHVCALKKDAKVLCWGANRSGQLGSDQASSLLSTPVEVKNLKNIEKIALGYAHTCAIDSSNDVYCWGNNSKGQLGLGNQLAQVKPAKVIDLAELKKSIKSDIKDLVLNDFMTCLETQNQKTICFGDSSQSEIISELSPKFKPFYSRPVLVSGLNKVEPQLYFIKPELLKIATPTRPTQISPGSNSTPLETPALKLGESEQDL